MHERQLGENLLGLATQGSYARNSDSDYSDLELVAFLRTVSKTTNWVSPVQILDGLFIDIIWTTKDEYIARVKEVTPEWYLAGSDHLDALINQPLIDEVNGYEPQHLRTKCRSEALRHWPETQEATGKVLSAIQRGDAANMGPLLFAMLRHVLIELSFLNERPYESASRMLTEAEDLPKRPRGFDDVARIAKEGNYTNLERTRQAVEAMFEGLEELFSEEGIAPYGNELVLPTLSQ